MEYTIVQTAPGVWELRASDGTVVETFTAPAGEDADDQALYYAAEGALRTRITTELEQLTATDVAILQTDQAGLLPERWAGDIAFSVELPGGRDFRNCAWSWRDPGAVAVPLMLMTETSEWGHLGAQLAGFVESFRLTGGTVSAQGRFYDNPAGVQFRDMLAAGPPFGVSVDPTENLSVDVHEECAATDDDGFCTELDFRVEFLAYEIGAVTGAPVAGFENAAISLAASAASGPTPEAWVAALTMFPERAISVGPDAALRAAATEPAGGGLRIPARPPRSYLTLAEPVPGEPFLGSLTGDQVLVEQLDRYGNVASLACPLTITDDGLVYGHLTWWGQCHTGNPWGPGRCASVSPSQNGYADFLTGATVCDDGSSIASGVLTVGCEHSQAMSASGVRDHLAHAGMGWAAVSITDGDYGPWVCGALHPDTSEEQVALLRRLSMSGEWVGELGGILSVNQTGLPVQRKLAASAWPGRQIEIPVALRASATRAGQTTRVVGANIVRACPECEERRRLAAHNATSAVPNGITAEEFRAAMGLLSKLEARTRFMNRDAADAALAAMVGTP